MSTAQFLLDSISLNNNITKEPNLEDWADTIRLIRERDNQSDATIRNAITNATNDEFWSKVCLSPNNLRKNFDRIANLSVAKRADFGTDRSEPLDKYKR